MGYPSVYLRQGLLLLLALALVGAASLVLVRSCRQSGQNVESGFSRQIEGGLRDVLRSQLGEDPRFQEIHSPAIDHALEQIRLRLDTTANSRLDWPIELLVVDNPEINAVTLPGGLILVYAGLVRKAHSVEEVAAVIAHEMGHVSHHDTMNALSRNLAIAGLLSAGGNASPELIRQVLQTLAENAFSRQVEADADRYALELLTSSSLRPAHLADFFKSLAKKDTSQKLEQALGWLGSHPDTNSRIRMAEQADAGFSGPEKTLGLDWKKVLDSLP